MRAAVLEEHRFGVREWPVPVPVEGEVLAALTRVGMCGSDVHFALERSVLPSFVPIVLGHEPAGWVVAVGPEVSHDWVGRRVAVIPIVACHECRFCRSGRTRLCPDREVIGADRHGCWAEFATVPERNLVVIPDALADDFAAVATDAVATALNAVRTRGAAGPGARVGIWGAGGLGLCAVAISRALGAEYIEVFDPREAARQRAVAHGADTGRSPDDAAGLRGRFDVALEFVGRSDSVAAAIRSLDRGGRAVVVGIGVERLTGGALTGFVMNEREVVGSVGAEPADVRDALRMLADGDLVLPDLVGDCVPLDGVPEALQRLADGRVNSGRVVVEIA